MPSPLVSTYHENILVLLCNRSGEETIFLLDMVWTVFYTFLQNGILLSGRRLWCFIDQGLQVDSYVLRRTDIHPIQAHEIIWRKQLRCHTVLGTHKPSRLLPTQSLSYSSHNDGNIDNDATVSSYLIRNRPRFGGLALAKYMVEKRQETTMNSQD